MHRYVYIFLGGSIGALLRYGLAQLNHHGSFPIGTFCANLAGAFLMGLLSTLAIRFFKNNANLKKGLTTGLLGALTTFSTFQFECLNMLQEGLIGTLALYAISSYSLGILLCYLGTRLGGRIQ
ncbi:fluoride efflux transporter CrcB [Staphylococcus pettenkoferi]|uniref:Fluoride-specific ion channel FluC n=1 Tax=Staphylococcus pettenkoferi TaxID=170573 RepID=A0A9Q4D5B7_9STAP|nr:fluoride efflux transporter CrcB [Staphylococcus pettenkoferi]MCY1568487.1 fluoride efflux transporter CrcB [Staphylococcus pettenkoferi]MCY1576604.1 fluoride efflux transporter CrcB [Staphylococcus pettenkoferi]MCY1594229.1 fluoride efflux transporter CrcB [Staphylococcus pettenkoferi]MCY1617179.1 fluoride efflux transporter CrcB [Staphylococcus pettenkoferi]